MPTNLPTDGAQPKKKSTSLLKVASIGGATCVPNALRESDPIHWSDTLQCWIVMRHADLVDALDGKSR